jgi:hypothetical protein
LTIDDSLTIGDWGIAAFDWRLRHWGIGDFANDDWRLDWRLAIGDWKLPIAD